jgi:hypothetical protein
MAVAAHRLMLRRVLNAYHLDILCEIHEAARVGTVYII